MLQDNDSDGFLNILEKLGAKKTTDVEYRFESIYLVLKIISLLITSYFVFKFYVNYKSIKIEENIKEFIVRIIKFKKTVNAFILISIILLVAFISIFTFLVFYVLNSQSIELSQPTLLGFLISIILSTVLCILLIWIYYRLVYGIILRRLDKNLMLLQDIDLKEK